MLGLVLKNARQAAIRIGGTSRVQGMAVSLLAFKSRLPFFMLHCQSIA